MTQHKHQTILFLCTGNYYRSRFAEILFNSMADKMELPWRASSRGLALERGIDNSAKRYSLLNPALPRNETEMSLSLIDPIPMNNLVR